MTDSQKVKMIKEAVFFSRYAEDPAEDIAIVSIGNMTFGDFYRQCKVMSWKGKESCVTVEFPPGVNVEMYREKVRKEVGNDKGRMEL